MNTNIENMVKELKENYPENWGIGKAGLDIDAFDLDEQYFKESNNFEEKYLQGICIYYKEISVDIYRKYVDSNDYKIEVSDFINKDILNIIDIVFNRLKKIEFAS